MFWKTVPSIFFYRYNDLAEKVEVDHCTLSRVKVGDIYRGRHEGESLEYRFVIFPTNYLFFTRMVHTSYGTKLELLNSLKKLDEE